MKIPYRKPRCQRGEVPAAAIAHALSGCGSGPVHAGRRAELLLAEYCAVIRVVIPPRGLNSASSRSCRGRKTSTKSSRMRFVAFS